MDKPLDCAQEAWMKAAGIAVSRGDLIALVYSFIRPGDVKVLPDGTRWTVHPETHWRSAPGNIAVTEFVPERPDVDWDYGFVPLGVWLIAPGRLNPAHTQQT